MSQRVEEIFASLGLYDNDEKPTHFEDLPDDAKKDILSRLPVIDIIHCRLVCTDWKALLFSSSNSSPSTQSSDFFKNFWVENRPKERWLFLHNGVVSERNLLYDVEHQVCYSWTPNSSVTCLAIFNTTTNGLLFAVQHINSTSVLHMWACNPLTGCETQLPDIFCEFVAAIAAHEDTTSRLEPHYKILLLGFQKSSLSPPGEHRELEVNLYSSKERKWRTHQAIRIHRLCILYEVRRFYASDMIYLLETPHPLRSMDDNWRADVHGLCQVRWFNIEGYTWDSCPISPPQDTDTIYDLEYFFLFERNKELILLAALASEETLAIEFRVYKSSSTITAGVKCSWKLLSSMPRDMSSGPLPLKTEESSHPQFRLESKIYADVFPSPDKAEGDKLVIILMGIESYNSVLSFNLESPAEDAWKTVMASTDVQNDQSQTRTSLEEKIVEWSKSAIVKFRGRTVLPFHQSIFQSGSFQGFTFEPRLDDIHGSEE